MLNIFLMFYFAINILSMKLTANAIEILETFSVY